MNRRLAAGAAMLMVAGVAPAVSSAAIGAAATTQAAGIPFDFDGDGYADLTVGVSSEDLRGKGTGKLRRLDRGVGIDARVGHVADTAAGR